MGMQCGYNGDMIEYIMGISYRNGIYSISRIMGDENNHHRDILEKNGDSADAMENIVNIVGT